MNKPPCFVFIVLLWNFSSNNPHKTQHETVVDDIEIYEDSPKSNEFIRTQRRTLKLVKNEDPEKREISIHGHSHLAYFKKTITFPSFEFLIPAKSPGVVGNLIFNYGAFAPIETSIFHYVLSDECSRTDKKKPSIIYDVGGNLGYFAVYAGILGCRVKTYEGSKAIAEWLDVNIKNSDLEDLVLLKNEAVGADHGTKVVMSVNNADWGFSFVKEATKQDSDDSVDLVSLDEEITEDTPLVKIDVEGFEDQVFLGMKNAMIKHNVENIIVEVKRNNNITAKIQFLNWAMDYGYTIYSYAENYSENSILKEFANIGGFSHTLTQIKRVGSISFDSWLPWEDIWLTKKPINLVLNK